jgi:hypothetical protein
MTKLDELKAAANAAYSAALAADVRAVAVADDVRAAAVDDEAAIDAAYEAWDAYEAARAAYAVAAYIAARADAWNDYRAGLKVQGETE